MPDKIGEIALYILSEKLLSLVGTSLFSSTEPEFVTLIAPAFTEPL